MMMNPLSAAEPAGMAWFAVAATMRPFERDEIGADSLSAEEALDALALDLSANRHVPQLTQRLSAYPAADVARGVNVRMLAVRDEWGSIHLANLAGELRLADTIPTLINCLTEEIGDFLCE